MSLSASLFQKHGKTSFEVWLDQGQTVCVAVKKVDRALVGFLRKDLWSVIEWQEASARLQAIESSPYFEEVESIQIMKRGWFALSTVAFTMVSGRHYVGKTDKGFADFLVTIL